MKINDAVICITNVSAPDLEVGKVYLIIGMTEDGEFVQLDNDSGELYCSWRFSTEVSHQ